MRLLEWQGRAILEKEGIPVPAGGRATTRNAAREAASAAGGAVVLKAQVPVGGRGKAGGIRMARDPDEAARIAGEMLGSELKGLPIHELLVVEAVAPVSEHYLSVALDRRRRAPVMIYSPRGGVDIEEVARTDPGAIRQVPIPPLEGPLPFRLRQLVSPAPPELRKPLAAIAGKLYHIFTRYEATLAEINPLAETERGLVALDAKLILDDDHRPGDQFAGLADALVDPLEADARAVGMSYVRLEGDIGVLGNGAGLVMATLDLVAQAGGRPANFLDIGGGARAERVRKGVELIRRDGKAKVLFVNVFGGITRCDEVAQGVVEATVRSGLPMVIRLTGTNEAEGRAILSRAGLVPVHTMEEGAARAVALAKEAQP
ncbi:MAG: ADP-forming succinate--CoA ligase subunit beta [Candidatus Bipolaricaulis anaerobius]|nr:ADP-forming succinate--CoA ligase subunit beta [Candidatus Bipolaricaulis anaerobius]